MSRQLTFASLFSGCGGFDVGFDTNGFRCIGAYDNDPHVVRVHHLNHGPIAEMLDLSSDAIRLEAIRNVDVLISGSPCQGFSTAGKRLFSDPRNHLLLVAGHIAAFAKPKVFLAENVVGVASGSHKEYWEALHLILRSAGYLTTDFICDGTQMGVAQIRRRRFLIAWRTPVTLRLRLPQKLGGILRDAIGNMEGTTSHDKNYLVAGSVHARIAERIRQGQKLSDVRGGNRAVPSWEIPEVFGATTPEEQNLLLALRSLRRRMRTRDYGDADPVSVSALNSYFRHDVELLVDSLESKKYLRRKGCMVNLSRGYNGKYRRLLWNAPSLNVDTCFGAPNLFLHPVEQRGFTIREAARIQGFPDTFEFKGPERAQYRMIGNAVPPPMAECLSEFVRSALL